VKTPLGKVLTKEEGGKRVIPLTLRVGFRRSFPHRVWPLQKFLGQGKEACIIGKLRGISLPLKALTTWGKEGAYTRAGFKPPL